MLLMGRDREIDEPLPNPDLSQTLDSCESPLEKAINDPSLEISDRIDYVW